MGKRAKRELPSEIFCDASFLVAYFAVQDRDHHRAQKVREKFLKKSVRLYTSWPTLSEAATILLYHYGYSHATALLQSLPAFHAVTPTEGDHFQAAALFKEFNRDQKLSFNDLLTYVLIRGALRNMPIVTFDRDFAKVGLTLFVP